MSSPIRDTAQPTAVRPEPRVGAHVTLRGGTRGRITARLDGDRWTVQVTSWRETRYLPLRPDQFRVTTESEVTP